MQASRPVIEATPDALRRPAPDRFDSVDVAWELCYREAARAQSQARIEQGRAITASIERHDRLPTRGLDCWLEERRRQPCDLRKLLAAVPLIGAHPR